MRISLACRISVWLSVAMLASCSVSGRSGARHRAVAEKAQAEARARPQLVGRLALINAEEGFALVDGVGSQTPAAGTILRSYSGGALSGELRATGVKRRPFFVADIVRGKPEKGDLVLQPGEGEAAMAPRAVAVPRELPTPPARPFPVWKRWLVRSGLLK